MKRFSTLFIALLVILSLAGCGDGSEPKAENTTTTIATTVETTTAEQETTASHEVDAVDNQSAQAGGEYSYEGISIVLPDGFTVEENDVAKIAYPPEYPNKTDNITFTSAAADSIDNYTQKTFDDLYSDLFKGFGGSDRFEKTTINGCDVIIYSYNISINDVDMKQDQVMVFLDTKTVTVTFTKVSGDYDKAFSDSLNSIKALVA